MIKIILGVCVIAFGFSSQCGNQKKYEGVVHDFRLIDSLLGKNKVTDAVHKNYYEGEGNLHITIWNSFTLFGIVYTSDTNSFYFKKVKPDSFLVKFFSPVQINEIGKIYGDNFSKLEHTEDLKQKITSSHDFSIYFFRYLRGDSALIRIYKDTQLGSNANSRASILTNYLYEVVKDLNPER